MNDVTENTISTLDITEREYRNPPLALSAFSILVLGVSLPMGVIFSVLRYVGLVDWAWPVATAGIWIPAVLIAVAAVLDGKLRRSPRTV